MDFKILPFGSSVNSFGKCDSDLDMVISHQNMQMGNEQIEYSPSRLIFHTRGMYAYILALAKILF